MSLSPILRTRDAMVAAQLIREGLAGMDELLLGTKILKQPVTSSDNATASSQLPGHRTFSGVWGLGDEKKAKMVRTYRGLGTSPTLKLAGW